MWCVVCVWGSVCGVCSGGGGVCVWCVAGGWGWRVCRSVWCIRGVVCV